MQRVHKQIIEVNCKNCLHGLDKNDEYMRFCTKLNKNRANGLRICKMFKAK